MIKIFSVGNLINCEGCGRKIIKKSWLHKFCKKCGRKNTLHLKKQRYLTKVKPFKPLLYFINCEECGEMILRNHNGQKYCKDCARIQITESKYKSQLKYLERNKPKLEFKRKNRIRQKEYYKKYPERVKAIRVANYKIKIQKGKLCELCNLNEAKEKHHEDYSKPLEVLFLCSRCHKKIHSKNKERWLRFVES